MDKIALEVDSLSKQYRLGQVGTGTLSHDLNRWWHKIRGKDDPYLKIGESNDRSKIGESEYVWALKDINFRINQGDAIGIIGRNGAGKSTLLKLLSKVTKPSLGRINVNGRIASLLEVGTGFHPEMTGRENIYLNGAILGMTRREIKRKFDEIVDFAGVERYIDTPVKRYSSGMYVRLAFAVAAHLESEILIVDEVLAVGDAEFQKKCLGKMGDVSKGEGRTVLFVSHNMSAVNNLCNNGIYMKNGMLEYVGNISDTISKYMTDGFLNESIEFEFEDILTNGILIKKFLVNNLNHSVIDVNAGDEIKFFILFQNYIERQISIEVKLFDINENIIAFYSKAHLKGDIKEFLIGENSISENFILPKNITSGTFYMQIDLTHPNIEYIYSFKNRIKLNITGCSSITGNSFNYTDRGLIILS